MNSAYSSSLPIIMKTDHSRRLTALTSDITMFPARAGPVLVIRAADIVKQLITSGDSKDTTNTPMR